MPTGLGHVAGGQKQDLSSCRVSNTAQTATPESEMIRHEAPIRKLSKSSHAPGLFRPALAQGRFRRREHDRRAANERGGAVRTKATQSHH